MGKRKTQRAVKTRKTKIEDVVQKACKELGCSVIALFRRAHKAIHGSLDGLRVKKDYQAWTRSKAIAGYVLRYLRVPKVPKADRQSVSRLAIA